MTKNYKSEKNAWWLSQVHKDLKGDEDLPLMFESALIMSSSAEEALEVLAVIKKLGQLATMGARGLSKIPLLSEIVKNCDPNLIFQFAHKAIFFKKNLEHFLRSSTEILKSICPNREAKIEELVMVVGRRLLGDEDVLYPLLDGPPGTGKSFVVELLGDVFSELSVPSKTIIQPMTQMGHSQKNNEISMALQGTSAH